MTTRYTHDVTHCALPALSHVSDDVPQTPRTTREFLPDAYTIARASWPLVVPLTTSAPVSTVVTPPNEAYHTRPAFLQMTPEGEALAAENVRAGFVSLMAANCPQIMERDAFYSLGQMLEHNDYATWYVASVAAVVETPEAFRASDVWQRIREWMNATMLHRVARNDEGEWVLRRIVNGATWYVSSVDLPTPDDVQSVQRVYYSRYNDATERHFRANTINVMGGHIDCGLISPEWFRVSEWSPLYCSVCNNYAIPATRDVSEPCTRCEERGARRCDSCSRVYVPNDNDTRPDSDEVCTGCTAYMSCYDCGNWSHVDDVTQMCDCHRDRNFVRGYHATRSAGTQFHLHDADTHTSSRVFYGVELEVAFPSNVSLGTLARKTCDHSPEFGARFLPTQDSSIGGNGHGVEFVSDPMTWATWREFAPEFTSACDYLRRAGARAWNATSCGAHVHVSRHALVSPDHLVRLYAVMSHDGEATRALASRDLESWNGYCGALGALDERRRNILRQTWRDIFAVSFGRDSRYLCLNLNNPHTLEFRLWRASLRAETVLEQIDATRALLAFTRDVRPFPLTIAGYAAWTHANAKEYTRASTLLARRLPAYAPRVRPTATRRPTRRNHATTVEV